MSKKKNTLKDLDEFLRQQAATLVPPSKLSDKIQDKPVTEESKSQPDVPPMIPATSAEEKNIAVTQKENVQHESSHSREQLCDLIIKNVESRNQYTPEDRMLINTVLYLKSGEQWRDVIRQYWRKRAGGLGN